MTVAKASLVALPEGCERYQIYGGSGRIEKDIPWTLPSGDQYQGYDVEAPKNVYTVFIRRHAEGRSVFQNMTTSHVDASASAAFKLSGGSFKAGIEGSGSHKKEVGEERVFNVDTHGEVVIISIRGGREKREDWLCCGKEEPASSFALHLHVKRSGAIAADSGKSSPLSLKTDPDKTDLEKKAQELQEKESQLLAMKKRFEDKEEIREVRLLKIDKALDGYAFGGADWNKYFGRVVSPPRPPIELIDFLARPCPFGLGRRVQDSHVLVYVPSSVEGLSLSAKVFSDLLRSRDKREDQKDMIKPNRVVKEQRWEEEISCSHWALVTKDILPETRGRSYSEQIEKLKPHQGYEVPKMLPALVALVANFIQKGQALYPGNPDVVPSHTFTNCCEKLFTSDGETHVVVGGFESERLNATLSSTGKNVGMGAMRIFYVQHSEG